MKGKFKELTEEEKRVIIYKETEAPYSGEYDKLFNEGTYVCRRCEKPLYNSTHKFNAGCGWPSFDDEINGAVVRVPVMGGMWAGMEDMWQEIVCANCKGHLGHVFVGEGLTSKNTRHCVNSISLKFIPKKGK